MSEREAESIAGAEGLGLEAWAGGPGRGALAGSPGLEARAEGPWRGAGTAHPARGAGLAHDAGPLRRAPDLGPRIVCNSRPGVDWNTCGQAAIATVLACVRLGPFAAGADVSDGDAIDWVRREFPGDVPLGIGTSAGRIATALRAHGLAVERVHSGWFALRAAHALERLVTHVGAGYPVPVCIDMSRLGASFGAAHWAIVTAIEGDHVRLANAGFSEPLVLEQFLELWRCRWLPYGHNHAAVLAWA